MNAENYTTVAREVKANAKPGRDLGRDGPGISPQGHERPRAEDAAIVARRDRKSVV